MIECPYCHLTEGQMKAGKTVSGRQRYQCNLCRSKYTPNAYGYTEEQRLEVIKLSLQGLHSRQIGRALDINHQTVINWTNAYRIRQNSKKES
jgi:transposase-like protein